MRHKSEEKVFRTICLDRFLAGFRFSFVDPRQFQGRELLLGHLLDNADHSKRGAVVTEKRAAFRGDPVDGAVRVEHPELLFVLGTLLPRALEKIVNVLTIVGMDRLAVILVSKGLVCRQPEQFVASGCRVDAVFSVIPKPQPDGGVLRREQKLLAGALVLPDLLFTLVDGLAADENVR